MEAMEIDSPVESQRGGSTQPDVATAAGHVEDANPPLVISDSGSSTEVDEDDDDSEGPQAAVHVQPRLPATWAFSQRAVGSAAATTQSASQRAPMRRRLRYVALMHDGIYTQ